LKKVLLFNPKSALRVCGKSKIKALIPNMANMGLAIIAGALQDIGVTIKIIDLILYREEESDSLS